MKLETILKFRRQILFEISKILKYRRISKTFQASNVFSSFFFSNSSKFYTINHSIQQTFNHSLPFLFQQSKNILSKVLFNTKKNLIKPLFHGTLIIQKRSSKLPQITLKTPKIRRYSLRASSLPLHAD